VLFNGFDSMVLSDDSGSKTNDDAHSYSSANFQASSMESTHGWPSLSRDSTLEDRSPPLVFSLRQQEQLLQQQLQQQQLLQAQAASFVSLTSEQVEEDEGGRTQQHKEDDQSEAGSEGDEWVQVEDGSGSAAQQHAYEESRRTSLEKGKAFLMEKMTMLQAHPLNEKFMSKAASLRSLAANMIKGEPDSREIYGGGAKQKLAHKIPP
jgi:hypothetical protein